MPDKPFDEYWTTVPTPTQQYRYMWIPYKTVEQNAEKEVHLKLVVYDPAMHDDEGTEYANAVCENPKYTADQDNYSEMPEWNILRSDHEDDESE